MNPRAALPAGTAFLFRQVRCLARGAGRRGGIVVALTLLLVACGPYRWQDQRLGPDDVIRQQHPAAVRVTKVDSARVVLRNPQLAGSTLVGVVEDSAGVATDSAVSIPLAAIARVAVWKPKAGVDAVVITSAIALGLLILLIQAHSPGP